VKAHAPDLLGNLPGSERVEHWQVIGVLTILLLTMLLAAIIGRVTLAILGNSRIGNYFTQPAWMAWTVGIGLAVLVGAQFIEHVGLTTARWPYFASVIGTFILLALSYAAWSLIHALSSLLQTYAARSDTPLDNIMVTFGTGVMRLLLLGGTGLLLGAMWSLPTTGLFAGLGIGGLAIAFASKETLSNIFGAGILLTDRPFQTGDRIIAGDVNGWVEVVNLRSTRIRMVDDSIIVVPNGKLADMAIINRGAKRRQVLSTTLLVTSGASREKLEAFTDDIRKRILSDPAFDTHDMEANVAEVDRHGVKIEIFSGLKTLRGQEYRRAVHLLLLDIMSMAKACDLTLGRGTETQIRNYSDND
jgi:small-conductance mechanosensitive channel